MKLNLYFLPILFLGFPISLISQQVPKYFPKVTPAGQGIVNTKIDNIGYWMKMARLGYIYPEPAGTFTKPIYSGSKISGKNIMTQDSPDIPVTDTTGLTQSENSIFADPENESILLQSNNSTDWNGSQVVQLFGADALSSDDGGSAWGGSFEGAGNENMGDPATAIGANGWWYVGKIDNTWGQSVAWSSDQGQTWHDVQVEGVPAGNNILDKNHLWIDNSPDSPYTGNLYAAWTYGGSGSPNANDIEFYRSVDHGLTWSGPQNLSQEVYAGYLNHGVNLNAGPNGEVYAVWSVYDNWPSDEKAIGFAKSLNGGMSFEPGIRIIDNIRGIRMTQTSKAMRVNSFPSMTIDNSNGSGRGTIYVVWANIGVPGTNVGPDIDIYMIKSEDKGDTWSPPVRINQDPSGLGKEHFFPWITCDPATGYLCVIYYDDRNVTSTQCETWVSYSYDHGNTWSDIKVSDVAFTPAPIAGLAISYFGDYLGITAQNRKIYPVWTDNRNGIALTYTSPFELAPAPGQPYVVYDSYELKSIATGTLQTLNYGDSLYLTLGLKNIGDQPAIGVSSELSTNSPYVTITSDIGNFGDFASGEIKTLPDGYSMKVSDSIPDGTLIRFNVWSFNADTSWYSHFFTEAHAPALHIDSLNIIDTLDGNRNGRFDPGETVDIILTVSNPGDFSCQSTYVKLSAASAFVTLEQDSVPVGAILPGSYQRAVFHGVISDEAPIGTGSNLTFRVTSLRYHVSKTFLETIGIIVEDWETHDFSKFPWEFAGAKQWFTTSFEPYEGHYCCKSGLIVDDQKSELRLTYISGIDDSISFYRKVSSEANYDFLKFYVDSVLYASWSGEEPWERVAYFVPAGTHLFQWIYSKDIFESVGEDRGWIDFIEFPPPPLPTVNAGQNDTLCGTTSYQLIASASDYDSLLWTTYGDGSFTNETILDPVYSMGPGDISNGHVRLRLTAFGPYGQTIRSLWLSIGDPLATAITVYPKDTLCAGQTVTLSVPEVTGGHYLWMPGGFTQPQIQVDTSVTGGVGMTLFKVDVSNPSGCHAYDSVNITFRDCTGIPVLTDAFEMDVYPNPTSGIFTLKIRSAKPQVVSMKILDLLDRTVYEKKDVHIDGVWSEAIDLSGLPGGIYFLKAGTTGDSGSLKIIKK